MGATELVLRMVRAGVKLDDLVLADPVGALHTVSHDLRATAQLTLATGKPRTAVSIQRAFHDRAQEYVAGLAVRDREAEQVLDLWGARSTRSSPAT